MPEQKRLAIYDLVRKRTGTIGVIVHRLDSQFIISALRGIQKVTTDRGYDCVIMNSRNSSEREMANTRLLVHCRVDGVFFGRAGQRQGSGTVIIDNRRCGYLATEHLIRQGCRRIAIVTSSLDRASNLRQYMGFLEALKTNHVTSPGKLVITEDMEADGGADVAQQVLLMDPLPDGLFITDDQLAASCMQTLKDAGIRVPEDMAIVGLNNDPVSKLVTPALTTIDYPGYEIGKTAASTLLDQLSSRRTAVHRITVVVPPTLIIRNSSVRSQLNNKSR